MVTIFEVKNFNPFPELLFNFIGIINELKPEALSNTMPSKNPKHLAPSLMISGSGNFHTIKIKKSLTSRYQINLIFGLFYAKSQPYSKKNKSSLNHVGTP